MVINNSENYIPGFMQKSGGKGPQSRAITLDQMEQVKQASLDQQPKHASVGRKSADGNLVMVLGKHWRAFAISMVGGAILLASAQAGVERITNKLHEDIMLGSNSTYTDTVRVIKENKEYTPMTRDAVGETTWWLDTATVANGVNAILEKGGDPLIVLGALSDTLDESFEEDELSTIVTETFGEDPNILVRNLNPERYDDGIKDPDFKEDIRNYIIQQTEAEIARTSIDTNNQLEAMFSSETVSTDSDAKGMGGK